MAIYHLSVKTISRSQGRSATAAAAYRAAAEITDERTGDIHDYTRKGGVEYTELVLPDTAPDWESDRSALWNAAEQAETRKNSTVAREFEIALPAELSATERQKLAIIFAKEIVARHGVAADVAIHEPSRGGDNRNHHAHILISTRQLSEEGFTKKTRELDDRKSGEVERWRERFAELQNDSFKKNGIEESVDHRSLKDQGIDRAPSKHLGVIATNYERRTGQPSRRRHDFDREAAERLTLAKETGELEREVQQLETAIIILSDDLKQAKQAKADSMEQSIKSYQPLFDSTDKEMIAKGLNPTQRATIHEQIKTALMRSIEAGDSPKTYTPAPQEQEPESNRKALRQQEQRDEQHAQQTLSDLNKQLRENWRKAENQTLLNEAQQHRERHKALNAKEPKSLFKGAGWKREHDAWVEGTNRIRQELIDTLEAANAVLGGKSLKERQLHSQFEQTARASLKKHYPELDQVLTNKSEREQQERRERLREEQRQQQELKGSQSKDRDLNR